jgi:hypothetical protein
MINMDTEVWFAAKAVLKFNFEHSASKIEERIILVQAVDIEMACDKAADLFEKYAIENSHELLGDLIVYELEYFPVQSGDEVFSACYSPDEYFNQSSYREDWNRFTNKN